MNLSSLIRVFGATSCIALVSCGGIDDDEDTQRSAGYSLDNAPTNQNRYMAGAGTTQLPATTATTTSVETTTTTDPAAPDTGLTAPSTTTTTTSAPVVTPPTTPSTPATPASPSYGSPVAGRRGFVYPPGVEAKPENMVDVRDFTPGQKVRDPRTGKIFLVP